MLKGCPLSQLWLLSCWEQEEEPGIRRGCRPVCKPLELIVACSPGGSTGHPDGEV